MGSPPLVPTTLPPTRTRQGFSVHPVSRADVGSSLSCSTLVLPEQLLLAAIGRIRPDLREAWHEVRQTAQEPARAPCGSDRSAGVTYQVMGRPKVSTKRCRFLPLMHLCAA